MFLSRKQIIILLIIATVCSLFVTIVAINIIEYNLCYKKSDYQTHCYPRVIVEWLLPVLGMSFAAIFFLFLIAIIGVYLRWYW